MNWLELKIPPPIIGMITAFIMWLLSLYVWRLESTLLSNIGIAVIVLGVSLDVIAITGFGVKKTTINPLNPNNTHVIVDTGIYKLSRNPMYLGMAVSLLGWCFFLKSPMSIFALPIFILYLNRFQIVPEEKILAEKFGANYTAYKNSVRRWL